MLGLIAALLSVSAPAPATARDDVDPIVARVAAEIQELAGLQTRSHLRVTGVRVERRTLILSVDLRADTSELVRPLNVASAIAIGICADPNRGNFFSDGRALRVEVARAGRAEGTVTVDRCPGPPGQGPTAATFAAGMQSLVGVQTHGMTIAAVRTEGSVVIVTLAFPRGTPPMDATAGFLEGFCQNPEDLAGFFGNGVVIRVDTRIGDGDPVPGPPVTACPGH